MLSFYVVVACVFAAVSCGHIANYNQISIEEDGHGESGGKGGFSAGSGLRTIAQGSAEQANNAVVNQHTAARQAAFAAQSTLAQAAVGAAATAQAALVGKQILVQRLEREVQEASSDLQAEFNQLQLAQRSASAAQEAAQQAQQQSNAISAAANAAQSAGAHAQQAAEQTTAVLGSQSAMVGAAKRRLATLSEQLHAAEADLEATRTATENAEASAQIAQSNAAQAAASASSSSSIEHASLSGGAHGFSSSDEFVGGYHH